jgi:hypothetical protein
MSLYISTGSVHEIIAAILLLAIIIVVSRFFGSIIYAIFCYDTCCCKKQTHPIAPIPTNAIQTIVPFAEAIIQQPHDITVPLITAIKINK